MGFMHPFCLPSQAILDCKCLCQRIVDSKRFLLLKCHDDPAINSEHISMNRVLKLIMMV